jgi:hypothetical protein
VQHDDSILKNRLIFFVVKNPPSTVKSLSRALKQVAKLPCCYAVRPLFQDPRPGFRRTAVLRLRNSIFFRVMHKVLMQVEYRAVSGVFQNNQKIDPPKRVWPLPAPTAGRWESGGSIFWKKPDILLASYNIISLRCYEKSPTKCLVRCCSVTGNFKFLKYFPYYFVPNCFVRHSLFFSYFSLLTLTNFDHAFDSN